MYMAGKGATNTFRRNNEKQKRHKRTEKREGKNDALNNHTLQYY